MSTSNEIQVTIDLSNLFDLEKATGVARGMQKATIKVLRKLGLEEFVTDVWIARQVKTGYNRDMRSIGYGIDDVLRVMLCQAWGDATNVELSCWTPDGHRPTIEEHLANIILHEISHAVIHKAGKPADHGPEFRATLVDLWNKYGSVTLDRVGTLIETCLRTEV